MYLPKKISLPQDEQIPRWILLAGLVAGTAFFVYYYMHRLTLAHYDAKAHLLVARRIVDSLEPGYSQMGVNWLPLLHLIYLPFVVFDSQYRSGLLPSLISVCAFALSGWLTYRISYRFTGSTAAGVFAAIVLLANPNLEYLQSCPLTEPVYMALFLLAVDRLIAWRESDHSGLPWLAAIWTALGALCRYEGWFFLAGVLALLSYDYWRQYVPRRKAVQAGAVFLGVCGIPAAAHFGYIFFRLGDNFFHRVAAGNPAPYLTYKRPVLSFIYHLAELSQMAAILPLLLAVAGLLLFLYQRRKFGFRAPLILLWLPSLINISALYWGMIYRLRYSVLLLPAVAIFGSIVVTSITAKKRSLLFLVTAVMALPWLSWFLSRTTVVERLVPGPGALVLPAVGLVLFLIARTRQCYGSALLALCILGMQFPPLAREDHPMMAEALEHQYIEPERHEVLQYLRQNRNDGRRILIDMSKLAPLVYDSGLPVKDFVYNEGGEVLWHKAMRNPAQEVGWLCAQKGDAVWERLQVDPNWADEYALAVKTELFSLYRLKR
jgi:hypothetical protein